MAGAVPGSLQLDLVLGIQTEDASGTQLAAAYGNVAVLPCPAGGDVDIASRLDRAATGAVTRLGAFALTAATAQANADGDAAHFVCSSGVAGVGRHAAKCQVATGSG